MSDHRNIHGSEYQARSRRNHQIGNGGKTTTDHRNIHGPEYQAPMHVMRTKPACFVEEDQPVTERGAVTEGWADGVKPGMRNPFHDLGRSCGAASTPAVWQDTLRHTPGCFGCQRARRSLEVSAGLAYP